MAAKVCRVWNSGRVTGRGKIILGVAALTPRGERHPQCRRAAAARLADHATSERRGSGAGQRDSVALPVVGVNGQWPAQRRDHLC